MLRENESLQKENNKLKKEKHSLLKSKDIADTQVVALMKSLEDLQKDIKDKEVLVIILDSSEMLQHVKCTLFMFSGQHFVAGSRNEAVYGKPKERT